MTRFAFCLLLMLALLPACSGGKCDGPYTGTWTGTTITDQLTLTASCEYSYRGSDGCKSAGTYSAPIAPQGQVLISITAATPGNCLGVGSYPCDYSVSGSLLTVDCGTAGVLGYAR